MSSLLKTYQIEKGPTPPTSVRERRKTLQIFIRSTQPNLSLRFRGAWKTSGPGQSQLIAGAIGAAIIAYRRYYHSSSGQRRLSALSRPQDRRKSEGSDRRSLMERASHGSSSALISPPDSTKKGIVAGRGGQPGSNWSGRFTEVRLLRKSRTFI